MVPGVRFQRIQCSYIKSRSANMEGALWTVYLFGARDCEQVSSPLLEDEMPLQGDLSEFHGTLLAKHKLLRIFTEQAHLWNLVATCCHVVSIRSSRSKRGWDV